MQFNLISIFPEFFDQLKHGVLGKAKDLGPVSYTHLRAHET